MDENIRRTVAYAAARRVLGKVISSIYSHSARTHTFMNETYDYGSSAALSGILQGNIYHCGNRAHVQLSVNGDKFTGYDYSSQSHFRGEVLNNGVQVYDFKEGKHFRYLI